MACAADCAERGMDARLARSGTAPGGVRADRRRAGRTHHGTGPATGCCRSDASRAISTPDCPGTTWSNCMITSAPRFRSMRMTDSGVNRTARSIDVAPEVDTVLIDGAQRLEREHLESARIRDDGTVPSHEAVQATQVADHLIAGPEMQVIGVGQDHPRADGMHVGGVERLDGGERGDRHEGGRFDGTVRRHEHPCTGAARSWR